MRGRRATGFVSAFCVVALAACAAPSRRDDSSTDEASAAARWETMSARRRPTEPCTSVASNRISVVRTEQRADATERLHDVQIIALDDTDAALLTGNPGFVNATPGFHPFLVRAVAKNSAPAFFVQSCGATLIVLQGSLGRSTPPSYRMPLVVLLERAPERVEVLWDIAE